MTHNTGDEKWVKKWVPQNWVTHFSMTCIYGRKLSDEPHAEIGQYVGEVFAHGDLPAFVELLTPYGKEWYAPKKEKKKP